MKKNYFLFLSMIISSLFLFDSAMALNEFEKKTIIDSLKAMTLTKIDDDKVNADLGDVEFTQNNGKTAKIPHATPLALAINIVDKTNHRENSNTVKLLLRKNADLFYKYTLIENSKPSEMIPIQSLANDNKYAQDLTDWLMNNKNKINEYVDSDNSTMTHVFAYSDNDLGLLETLVKAGANIEAVNKYGKTPLHIALEKIPGTAGIRAEKIAVYFLYSTSIDLTKIYTYKKTDPYTKMLRQVTESLFKTVCDTAIEYSIGILLNYAFENIIRLKKHNEILNSSGSRLMHYLASVPEGKFYLKSAATYDEYKPLLSDLNSKNDEGETPLFLACDHNTFKNVQALLELKADINCKDKKNNTLIHAAVDKLEILTHLLEKTEAKSAINLKNSADKTPIQELIDTIKTLTNKNITKYNDNIKLLLEYGAHKDGLEDLIKNENAYKNNKNNQPFFNQVINLINTTNAQPNKVTHSSAPESSSPPSSSSSPSGSPSKVKKNNPPPKGKKIKDPLTENLSKLKKKLRTLKEKLKDLAKNLATLKSNLK
ncbi:ankyrin repeat domain-containing protein [Candidatus Dependentiae bacterium]|nr:ankyrin repeat domain-containing protein [Candidatus Dependentiae bacterium]